MAGIIIVINIAIISYLVSQRGIRAASKYRTLKRDGNIFIIIGVGVLIIFSIFFGIQMLNRRSSKNETSAPADGFTISSYAVNLDVNENGLVKVTEEITVDFYNSGHHGIYKFIPEWLEYTGQDGKTVSRKSIISNLQAIGENYQLDTVKGKERIKIGNSNATLPIGPHRYIITYDYDMGADPYKGFDEFIFHAFGDYWGTSIENASITLKMPFPFQKDEVKFFADKYRKTELKNYIDYEVNGSTLYASVSSSYNLLKSLTIDIVLPENYFKVLENETNYGNTSLLINLSIIGFSVLSAFLWYHFGRDFKYSETVEFYAPEGFDAATVGYQYKRESGKKLAIALIVELASKGYIRIDENPDKTRVITNLCSVEPGNYIKRKIEIKKQRELDDTLTFDEKSFMHSTFQNDIYATINADNTFYSFADRLLKDGYIKVKDDAIQRYSKEYLDDIRKTMTEKFTREKKPLSVNEKIVYDKLFQYGDTNILSSDFSFYTVFKELEQKLIENYENNVFDMKAEKFRIFTSIMFLIGTIAWIISFSFIKDMSPNLNFIYLLGFVALFIILIFVLLMSRRTPYGERMKKRIDGFKNFLMTAEKERLKMEVEKNPNYFYEILPFAYVLDVSKLWIEKFENIPYARPDMGNFDYCSMNSFNDLSDSVRWPESSSSGSNGCSSCGGGCSSCGGGCSSCGGGGSW